MTDAKRDQVIDRMVTEAYYWIGDQNAQASLSIARWLSQLTLSKKMKERVEGLFSDWRNIMGSKYKESDFPEIPIKVKDDANEELKLLWIASNVIMNTFTSGNYEMAYTTMMECCEDWPELYLSVLSMAKKSDIKENLAEWLIVHMLFACDLMGEKSIEIAGYRLSKIE